MNVIQLCGGLGNQLFQYAFGQLQMGNGIDVGYNTPHKYKTPFSKLEEYLQNKPSTANSH